MKNKRNKRAPIIGALEVYLPCFLGNYDRPTSKRENIVMRNHDNAIPRSEERCEGVTEDALRLKERRPPIAPRQTCFHSFPENECISVGEWILSLQGPCYSNLIATTFLGNS